jgi:hypothetical protein
MLQEYREFQWKDEKASYQKGGCKIYLILLQCIALLLIG